MSSRAYESAKLYYPTYWSIDQLNNLVKAEKLTKEEYKEVTGLDFVDSTVEQRN